jgi:hypothetical protein
VTRWHSDGWIFKRGFRGLLDLFFRDLDLRVFQVLDVSVLQDFWRLGFFRTFGSLVFEEFFVRFSFGSDFFRIGSKRVFQEFGFGFSDIGPFRFFGSGYCRLLIQRCKMERETGTFFDEGVVLPDERSECPTNG